MVKIATIQGWLYGFIFHNRNAAYLQQKNGVVRPSIWDQFDYYNADMPEWLTYMRRLALVHVSLWGTATLLYGLAMSGVFPIVACFWLNLIISNFEWVIYGYGTYLLVMASVSWGWVFFYLFMAVIFWFLSWLFFGMGAINFLDPDYPYLDGNLIPSFLYLFIDHEFPMELDVDWSSLEEEEDSEISSEANAELELEEKDDDTKAESEEDQDTEKEKLDDSEAEIEDIIEEKEEADIEDSEEVFLF